jgi:hypothetical protein
MIHLAGAGRISWPSGSLQFLLSLLLLLLLLVPGAAASHANTADVMLVC